MRATAIMSWAVVPTYWSCKQNFKVPRKFVPRPGSRADVESDLPATRP